MSIGSHFAGDDPPALGGEITLTMKEFREQATRAVIDAMIHDRRWVDWIAALAYENPLRKKDECVKSTFDFSAGRQKFLKMARSILRKATPERIHASLFADWVYPDTGESLRWDPLDESRRYALSAIDPTNSSKNPIRTDFSANALAFAALPTFPIVEGRPLCSLPNSAWRWPLWSVPLTLDITQSLLSRKEIYEQRPPAAPLRALGVETIFECSVVLPVGYYRNFSPARRIG